VEPEEDKLREYNTIATDNLKAEMISHQKTSAVVVEIEGGKKRNQPNLKLRDPRQETR
jgi:hypothetical protein